MFHVLDTCLRVPFVVLGRIGRAAPALMPAIYVLALALAFWAAS